MQANPKNLLLKLTLVTLLLNGFMLSLSFAKSSKDNKIHAKVIYGDDNRESPDKFKTILFTNYSKSVAGMISTEALVPNNEGNLTVVAEKYKDSFNLCSTERFAEEKSAMMCTGFLVAPDVLVTAGHCMRDQAYCDSYSWVFDYSKDEESVPPSRVYHCKEVIKQILDPDTLKLDYAVIRLDRAVEDRQSLQIRKEGKINENEDVLVIGHPMGISLKIADGANVRDNSNETYFFANLDTYGGNSGSPVFNSNTGLIEGILVEGEVDLVTDMANRCNLSHVCDNNGCHGEKVIRITSLDVLKDLVP